MSALARQRCWQHPERQATGLCMECRHAFCRECTTEHGERLICAACLARLSGPAVAAPSAWRAVPAFFGFMAGVVLTWAIFYGLGRMLMSIPATWHTGYLWGRLAE